MKLWVIACVMIGLGATARAADTEEGDSPKQVLVAQDAAARAGRVQEDRDIYQAQSEQQRKLADAFAAADVALSKLQMAVEKQFGQEMASAVAHAAGTEDVHDIQSATETIDGDHATIEFKDHSTTLHMVKVDGKWKISLTDMLKEADPGEIEQLTLNVAKLTDQIKQVADRVEQHKYRSGEGVRDRVQEIHDQLFGGEQK